MVSKYDQSCKFDGDLVAETQTRFTPRTMRSALALVFMLASANAEAASKPIGDVHPNIVGGARAAMTRT